MMRVTETAKYLGFHEQTIYRWARSGQIPAIRLGGTWVFRRGDVEDFLASQAGGAE
jgi:excisionase family DNA binding protein